MLIYLLELIKNKFTPRARILFLPHQPNISYAIKKICWFSGMQTCSDVGGKYDVVIHWQDSTLRDNAEILSELNKSYPIINIHSNDISKENVERCFFKAFGYGLAVDPLRFNGKCVKKSNGNASHDGEILNCPILKKEAGYVYQRLLEPEVEEGLVEDIRTPVFLDSIPLVYLGKKEITSRFARAYETCKVAKTKDVFSDDEIHGIILFCKELGMDYGDLDIIRNKQDGKIYIVDANNTPFGPPNSSLTKIERKIVRETLKKSFNDMLEKVKDKKGG